MLNREALRAAVTVGPLEAIAVMQRLGYCRGRFSNGLECIATKDGSDWVGVPCCSMRQAPAFFKQWDKLPLVQMP